MANLQTGLAHTATYQITRRMTVPELFLDDPTPMPAVLATAYLLGLMERACMELMAPHLETGEGSLGIAMDMQHGAPTLEGMSVTIDVRCVAVEGRKCTFEIEAHDELAVIGTARHDRAVVAWERFDRRLTDMRDTLAKN